MSNITREEGLLKDDLYELSNYDKVRTSRIIKHIKALEEYKNHYEIYKQIAIEQASEIDRFKKQLNAIRELAIDYDILLKKLGLSLSLQDDLEKILKEE